MTLSGRKTKWFKDSEARVERSNAAAAMVLRNEYNDPVKRQRMSAALQEAAVGVLTADEILENAREDMVKRRKQ